MSSCVHTFLNLTGIKRKRGRKNCFWVWGETKEHNYRKYKCHKNNHDNRLSSPRSTSQVQVDAGFASLWLLSHSREGIRMSSGAVFQNLVTVSAKSVDPYSCSLKFPWVSLLRFGCMYEGLSSYWGPVVLDLGWIPMQENDPIHMVGPQWNLNHNKSKNQDVVGINTRGTGNCELPKKDKTTSPCHCLTRNIPSVPPTRNIPWPAL